MISAKRGSDKEMANVRPVEARKKNWAPVLKQTKQIR